MILETMSVFLALMYQVVETCTYTSETNLDDVEKKDVGLHD